MPSSSNPGTALSSKNTGHQAPARHNQPLGMTPARWRFPQRRLLRGEPNGPDWTLTCTGVRRRPIGGDRTPSLLWHDGQSG